MKRIVLLHKEEFSDECKEIQKIFVKRGYVITMAQACFLWEKYCRAMSEGLLLFASDDQVFESIQDYWVEESPK